MLVKLIEWNTEYVCALLVLDAINCFPLEEQRNQIEVFIQYFIDYYGTYIDFDETIRITHLLWDES